MDNPIVEPFFDFLSLTISIDDLHTVNNAHTAQEMTNLIARRMLLYSGLSMPLDIFVRTQNIHRPRLLLQVTTQQVYHPDRQINASKEALQKQDYRKPRSRG